MHLIDRKGIDTCPLLSIHDMRILRMVVDYEDDKVMFKDNPDVWHELPTTKKGLMMVPLTKEACERHTKTPSTAATTTNNSKTENRIKRKKKHLLLMCNAVATARWRMVWYHLPGCAAEKMARGSMKKGILPLSQTNCYPLLKADGWHKKMKSGTKN